jgi:hypothetical protein
MDFGVDYWEELIVPLDNYISKGTPTYLGSSNPNYQESLFQMVEHTLSGAWVCVCRQLSGLCVSLCLWRLEHHVAAASVGVLAAA